MREMAIVGLTNVSKHHLPNQWMSGNDAKSKTMISMTILTNRIMSENIKLNLTSGLWTIGWLFTIGFLKLSFWKAILGIIIWPVFLGKQLGGF